MKIEAKSYLKTLERLRSDEAFKLPCPLFNEESEIEKLEKQRVRELSSEDVLYYEHDLLNVVMDFVKSVARPS